MWEKEADGVKWVVEVGSNLWAACSVRCWHCSGSGEKMSVVTKLVDGVALLRKAAQARARGVEGS